METLRMNRQEPNVCGSTPVQILNIYFSKMFTGSNAICENMNRFTQVQTASNQTGAETTKTKKQN